jgi:hypothetical protein
MSLALYAYAALPAGSAIPGQPGLEGAGELALVTEGAVAALVSPVPAAWFAEGGLASDPEWVSRQALRHHAVCGALAGMALPLAFGAVFSSEAPLRLWLAERAGPLATALARAEGCAEWTLLLREDTPRLEAWLDAHDTELARLSGAAAAAGPGTRFLLERRLERARGEARARHLDAAATRLQAALTEHARALTPARTRDGMLGVNVLLPGAPPPALENMAGELDATGVSLTLSGPWPPYAFAREALAHAHA